jgi:hypothetical protein
MTIVAIDRRIKNADITTSEIGLRLSNFVYDRLVGKRLTFCLALARGSAINLEQLREDIFSTPSNESIDPDGSLVKRFENLQCSFRTQVKTIDNIIAKLSILNYIYYPFFLRPFFSILHTAELKRMRSITCDLFDTLEEIRMFVIEHEANLSPCHPHGPFDHAEDLIRALKEPWPEA